MDARTKAEDLIGKFKNVVHGDKFSLKKSERIQCAIIAVEEILATYSQESNVHTAYWTEVLNHLKQMK